MNTSRNTAITVGILYIIGTVAGILSLIVAQSILDAPEFLDQIAANAGQVRLGALFVLTMGLALALVPVLMFPILKKQNQALALGYVVFRGALETMTYIAMAISWLLLVNLSQDYVQAGGPAASSLKTWGVLLFEGHDAIQSILEIVFPLGALMFYYVLYQSQLIPRWLSGWGFIAAVVWFTVGLLGIFQLIVPMSTLQVVLSLPIALQEMVMAVWLIVKGFNSSVIAAESAQVDMTLSQFAPQNIGPRR